MNRFNKVAILGFRGAFLGLLALSFPLALAYASGASVQSLSPSTNVSVGTAVSFSVVATGFTNPTYSVSDSFGGGSTSNSNINSSGNFSWTPVQSDIGAHNFTITVNDSSGNNQTVQEQITVSVAPSISIQSLSPSSVVNVGQAVSFSVVQSGFTNPTYSLSDSFSGSTVSNSNINSSGNFSWTPAVQDVGSHTITITVSDSYGHSANASESLMINSALSVSIQSISPGTTINPGQYLTFSGVGSGFSNPSYAVNDSFSGSTISSSNINSGGYFSWTPTARDSGTHNITVTITDSSGRSAYSMQSITVQGSGVVIQGLTPGPNVAIGNSVTFTAYAPGFTNPAYTISDSFGGSTISNSAINSSSGYFSWTPSANELGTHTITVWATDPSGHSASVSQQISVQAAILTITSINPGNSVSSGAPLSFTAVPAGLSSPTFTVSDNYGGTSVTNSNISSSGYFTWTPGANESGTHTITVYAADSSGHSANASVTITVNPGVSIALTAPTPSASIAVGSNVVFYTHAFGFTSPSYTLMDIFPGTSISNGNINSSSGDFIWMPTANDVGTHTITVHATDPYGHNASANTAITVSAVGTQSSTSGLTSTQIQSVLSLLQSFGTSQAIINNVATVLGTQTTTTGAATVSAITAKLQALQSQLVQLQNQPSSEVTAAYQFTKPLAVGAAGAEVTELQKHLTAEGVYSGPINGRFGPLTKVAVQKYQAKHGLKQLGNVGPSTRALLNK